MVWCRSRPQPSAALCTATLHAHFLPDRLGGCTLIIGQPQISTDCNIVGRSQPGVFPFGDPTIEFTIGDLRAHSKPRGKLAPKPCKLESVLLLALMTPSFHTYLNTNAHCPQAQGADFTPLHRFKSAASVNTLTLGAVFSITRRLP